MLTLPDLDPGTIVAVDTETSGLHPDSGARVAVVVIGWFDGDGQAQARSLPFWQRKDLEQVDLFETDVNHSKAEWDQLLDWLKPMRLVFHNAKFDLTMLAAGTPGWPGVDLGDSLYWDTQLASRELDPLEPQGLDACGARAFDEGKTGQNPLQAWLRSQRLGKGRYDLVPWEMMEPYATQDGLLTIRLQQHQAARYESGEGNRRLLERDLAVCKALYRIEARGVPFDVAGSLAAAATLSAHSQKLKQQLPFKPTSPAATAYFYDQEGAIPTKVTPKGKPSLDSEALTHLVNQDTPWAAEWQEISKIDRAVSMWYQGYPDNTGPDGRMRTVYKQTRTVSGRMACERMQLQAIPKQNKTSVALGVPTIRSFINPPPGKQLWNLDLQQAELRVAAQYARCKAMLELVNAGADVHGMTAQSVLGAHPDDDNWAEMRDLAKRLNFAAIFQVGGRTFQGTLSKEGIYLPISRCEAIVKDWRIEYPEFSAAYRRAERVVDQRGYIKLAGGRHSWFGELDFHHTAWSRKVQGSLAEFLQMWLVAVEERWPGVILLTVHDSLLLELDEGDAETVAAEIAALGTTMGTDLFKVRMGVDYYQWDYAT